MKELMKTTSNRSVYNKTRKVYLTLYGTVSCALCKYHKGENYKKHGDDRRNWKNYRKHQWK